MGGSLNGAGLVMDHNFHLLDHMAPLAFLLNIPLITTEEETAALAKTFYPHVEIRHLPDIEFRMKDIAAEYDILFNCQYWGPSLKDCFQTVFIKEVKLVFCPHGQSDKGYKSPVLALYEFQDAVLLYGNLLKEMLVELNIWNSLKAHARVGNYRLKYHQLHEKREDALVQTHIFSKLVPSNQTLLYAPTWKDADASTSFFLACERILQDLPSHWNLILKVHPMLPEKDPALYYRLAVLEEKRPNFLVVHQFPLIYAILKRIDAYLGDYSSIGYDVLAFRKPMFFIASPHIPQARLHSCGQMIDCSKHIFQQIENGLAKNQTFRDRQTALYHHAFDTIDDVANSIHSLTGGKTATKVKSPKSPAAGVASSS